MSAKEAEALAERLATEATKLADQDPELALSKFDRVIELNRRLAGTGVVAKLDHLAENYLWRGLLHRKLDRFADAIGDAREALSYSLKAGNRWYQVESLNLLGALDREIGEYGAAQEAYEQALSLLRDLTPPRPGLQIQVLRNLAEVYRVLNNDPQADRALEAGLRLAEVEGDQVGRSLIRRDQGWSRQLANDLEGALGLYWSTFETRERWLPVEQIILFDRLASTLADLHRPADAWLASEEALKIARESKSWSDEMRLSVNRCRLTVQFPALDRTDGSPNYCSEAEANIRDLRDINLRSVFLDLKSRRLFQIGKLPEAIAAAKEAAEMIDSFRFMIPGRNGRSRFLEGRSDFFRHWADLLMEAHRREPAAGFDLEVLRVSEQLKARSLLELWSTAGVDLLSKASQHDREELQAKMAELDALQRARGKPETDARIATLLADLDRLRDKLMRMDVQGSSGGLPNLSLAEIQAKLDSSTAIVLLLFGENKSYLYVIRDRGPIRSFDLEVSPDELSEKADQFLQVLADSENVVFRNPADEPGRRLARLLWGDQEERLAMLPERLVFVGDGSLQRLPLYPLPRLDSRPDNPRELIDTHEVVYLPSLSLLRQWPARTESLGRPKHDAIVFGDPFYQMANHPAGTVLELGKEELKRNFPQGPEDLHLGRLPFADLESRNIEARFGTRPIKILLGPRASKVAVLAPETGWYSIVHFASHGLQDPQHDELSSLLLSEVDQQGQPSDGRLRLQDLYGMVPWRADLVVASACQTGMGDNLRLEGAGGVAQGFLQAGARRVVLSLWPVESETTAILMDYFYEHLLDGMPAGGALREASRDLRRLAKEKRKPWDSPHIWSPFIVVGDWSSFSLPSEGGTEQSPVSGVH